MPIASSRSTRMRKTATDSPAGIPSHSSSWTATKRDFRARAGTIGAFARPRVYSFAYLNPEDFPGFAFRIAFDIRMTQVRMPNLTCRNSDRWRTSYYAIYDATSLARPFHPTLKLGWIVEMQNTISKRRDYGKIIAQVKIDDPRGEVAELGRRSHDLANRLADLGTAVGSTSR